MVRYKPYERYKYSGVEWIGEIPEHWEVKKIKRIAQLKSGESITSLNINDEGDFPVYGGNGVRGYTTNYTHDGRFVVIGRQGALCGNINYAIGKFWASEHAVVASPRGSYQTIWFGELLRVMNLNQYSTAAAQPGLAVEQIINLAIPVPPDSEQQTISVILDRKTSEIDGLIADKEKLASLLQEYRQAIISEAVTKGLNPDVKMKDSGVEWIGEIPEHWEVNRVKYLLREIDERSMTGNEDLLSVSQYYGIRPRETVTEKVARADSLVGYKLCKQGDVVINKMLAWQGALGHSKFDGIVSPDYTVIRTFEAVCSRYIAYLFKTPIYTTEFTKESKGIIPSRWRLHMESLGRIYSLVPPFSEQQAIADHLDQKTSEVDDLISGIQESIAQLKSYRQSLISEAVTGKIDVRGVI